MSEINPTLIGAVIGPIIERGHEVVGDDVTEQVAG